MKQTDKFIFANIPNVFICVFIFLFLLFNAKSALARTCFSDEYIKEQEDPIGFVRSNSMIEFEGKVTDMWVTIYEGINDENDIIKFTQTELTKFIVEKSNKGEQAPGDAVFLTGRYGNCDCTGNFEAGKSYRVFASTDYYDKEKLGLAFCSFIEELSD